MESSASRLALHNILINICPNVYFQPPQNLRLVYPCIIYERERIDNRDASNAVYNQNTNYQVTVVDQNPDSTIVNEISKLVNSRHVRNFRTEGLNHDVFKIYY